MLPTGPRDRRAWLLLSATAGITEEIMYRGVLLLTLSRLIPTLAPLLICLVAVLIFAVGHVYQGWVGIIVTGLLAILFIALYLVTGSLLPGMVLHFALDARAAFIKTAGTVSSTGNQSTPEA
jgi:membrane protease YdiL (CAAX protease family)